MTTSDRTAADAVMILESLSRLLRASPNRLSSEDAETQAGYVDDAAGAVTRDANISTDELNQFRAYGGSEWDSALLGVLLPADQVRAVFARMYP